LENRTERGFPQRPHASSCSWKKEERQKTDYNVNPASHTKFLTLLCPAGLLMNFNAPTLKSGLKRLDHPDRYRKKIS
jgi:hypothetical protein